MKNKKDILNFKGISKNYKYEYIEFENIDENCIEIKATMKIDLNSKAAKNKLYKSWKKDKSPLLTQLQEFFRNHETDKKEGKTGRIYEIIEE